MVLRNAFILPERIEHIRLPNKSELIKANVKYDIKEVI